MTEAARLATHESVMEEQAERDFVRRFGRPPHPLRRSNPGKDVVRIRSPETGAWIDYDISGHQVRRMAEHNAAGVELRDWNAQFDELWAKHGVGEISTRDRRFLFNFGYAPIEAVRVSADVDPTNYRSQIHRSSRGHA